LRGAETEVEESGGPIYLGANRDHNTRL